MLLPSAGCGGPADPRPILTLATTTSTQDSGLLDRLVPMFERRSGIDVKVVAVGSGQALQLGRRGDADVILAHSPRAEAQFMAEGHGESRRPVMHNDFVLVGPPSDPANVQGSTTIAGAFAAIAEHGSPFISRGDESGTHQKESQIWADAGIEPRGDWYVKAGAGMGQALRMADQMRAYTLSDRATFLAERGSLELAIVSQGDPALRNHYHVIVVSPRAHPGVHAKEAGQFAEFLLSDEAREAIATFGVDRHGEPLFVPDGREEPR
jgi:tungstate transport system substrate-binding protein